MNINDNTIKNMGDLSVFLHETAALDISRLGSEWARVSELLERHAKFIDTYTIPSMTEDPKGKPRVAELVIPERPDLAAPNSVGQTKIEGPSPGFMPTGNGR